MQPLAIEEGHDAESPQRRCGARRGFRRAAALAALALSPHRQLLQRFGMLGPLVAALVLLLAFGRSTHGRSLQQQQPQSVALAAAASVEGFKEAGCANTSALSQWHPYRPGYHITAPYGWVNDPHGYFLRGGLHHLFFQYNPKATAWGAPFWGHVVSADLARWRWLPPALLPDSGLDFNGVWSGAATVAEDGTPWLSYTAAATHVPELGNFFQSQALAGPADPTDPFLRRWNKSAANPVLMQTPPGGTNFQFRDTTPANADVRSAVAAALAQQAGGSGANVTAPKFAWAVGTQAFCLGTAAIYTAPALEGPWTFSGNLFNQMALDDQLNGQCEAAGNPLRGAFGGPCNQFGSKCRMWEVTDFAMVAEGVYAIKWSDQERARDPFSAEWYVLSDELDPTALKLGPAFNSINSGPNSAFDTLLTGRLGGRPFAPLRLNYGSTYASKFERLGDGRLTMNTWVMESFVGCVDSCSYHAAAGAAYVARAPFKGALQLPRRVSYSPETRSLLLYPIDELRALRADKLVSLVDWPLPPSSAPLVLLPEARLPPPAAAAAAGGGNATRARQLEARLAFAVAPGGGGAANFSVGLRLLVGGGSYVDIRLDGAAAAPGSTPRGAPAVTALRVAVDKARAGGFTPAAAEGGPVPLPAPGAAGAAGGGAAWALPSKLLTLDVYVDHSVVEVYAMGGLARVTSRIYPADEAVAWGLAAFGAASGGGAAALRSAEVWSLDNAFAGQPPLC
ncbi:MAG: glycosyl hydrolase [Monoraphidium minutum]|nr:MAG: glycosyl hydrolase [Monoraphidium minutum]